VEIGFPIGLNDHSPSPLTRYGGPAPELDHKAVKPPRHYLAAALATECFVPAAVQKSRRGRGCGVSLPMKNTMFGLEQLSTLETDRKSLCASERRRHVIGATRVSYPCSIDGERTAKSVENMSA
jgi:hypothetical protein